MNARDDATQSGPNITQPAGVPTTSSTVQALVPATDGESTSVAGNVSSTPTAVSSPVVTAAPPEGIPELDLSELSATKCALESSKGSGFWGTAPAPTPTRVPAESNPLPTDSTLQNSYLQQAKYVAEELSKVSKRHTELWQFDLNSQQQAAALSTLNISLSHLCDAVVQLESGHGLESIDGLLRESVRVRHAWSVLAILTLIEEGTSQTESLDLGEKSTHSYISELTTALDDYGVDELTDDVVVEVLQGNLQFVLPNDWIVAGTQLQPIVFPPIPSRFEQLGTSATDPWGLGAAVRIRQVKNFENLTSVEASALFSGLTTRLGEIQSTAPVKMFGVDAVSTIVLNEETEMQLVVIVAAVHGFAVIAEYGCLVSQVTSCELLSQLLSRMVYQRTDS